VLLGVLALREERDACLRALCPRDPRIYRQDLIHSKGRRVDGTCEWIKEDKTYISWLDCPSQLLWVSGGPGKGKTMLSIFLVEELEKSLKQSRDEALIEYFCDYKDENRNTAIAVLKGLIYQLLRQQRKLFVYILPSFRIHKDLVTSFGALWIIFENMVRHGALGTVYCVLDGLDECDRGSLEMLLREFRALFSGDPERSTCRLHMLVVCRRQPACIQKELSIFPEIQLDADVKSVVSNDIQKYVQEKVNELSQKGDYSPELSLSVERQLLDRAKGTFLWVGIVANELEKRNAVEVEAALQSFPTELEQLYARMLLEVPQTKHEVTAKILRWVIMAVRPLTLTELSIALNVSGVPSLGLTRERVMQEEIFLCTPLISIFSTSSDMEVSLVHQSAKEYLLREVEDPEPTLEFFRISKELSYSINVEITQKCMEYLEKIAEENSEVSLERGWDISEPKPPLLISYPLLSYSALYWSEHAKRINNIESLLGPSHSFYKAKSSARDLWLRLYWAAEGPEGLPQPLHILHIASWLGIYPLVKKLLYHRTCLDMFAHRNLVNLADEDGRTPLWWAVWGGHEDIVLLLLNMRTVRLDETDRHRITPLHLAAHNGQTEVVNALIMARANIEAREEDQLTPLHLAAQEGHAEIVNALITARANINSCGIRQWTPLHLAAQNGHIEAVNALITSRANINAREEDQLTPLHLAAQECHTEIVNALITAQADIKACGEDQFTPLHVAAQNGHIEVVNALITAQADIYSFDIKQWTPLHFAAQNGHIEVVNALIAAQGDINVPEIKQWTPLHIAALNGHTEIVNSLITAQANVNAREEDQLTPLHLAAQECHTEIVNALITAQADIEACGEDQFTPLHVAAQNGHIEVVNALITAQADIYSFDIKQWTPLHFAAQNGHIEVVNALITARANINPCQEDQFTPLHLAAEEGHTEVVNALITAQADIYSCDIKQWTPLHFAAQNGHIEVVNALITSRANINAREEDQLTPLHLAAQEGHTEIVNALITAQADIEACQEDQLTPLHLAAQEGYTEVVDVLITARADVNSYDIRQLTPLHLAAHHGNTGAVNALIAARANIDAREEDQWTALHLAAQNGHTEIVNALITARADVNIREIKQWTPLHLATTKGHIEIVNALITARADVNSYDIRQLTPLHLAAHHGNTGAVNALIAARANTDARDKDQLTPLHLAAQKGRTEIVNALITARPHINALDGD
jgi:ankyrin repeat protein